MAVSVMKRLSVYAHSVDEDAIVRRLMALRCVSIEATELGEGQEALARVSADTQRGEAERRLARISEAIAPLVKKSKRKKGIFPQLAPVDREAFRKDGSYEVAWRVVEDVHTTAAKLAENLAEHGKAELLAASLSPWLGYDAKLNLDGTANAVVILGTLPAGHSLTELEAALGDTAAQLETVHEDKSTRYVSVACHRSDEEEVNRILSGYGFLRVTFKGIDTTAERAYEQTTQRIGALEAEQIRLDGHLGDLASELDKLETLYDIESTTLEAIKNRQKLAMTESCTVLCGWVPEKMTDRVTRALDKFECAYDLTDPEPGEEPPVLLENNGFASNFEWVLGMYSYPRYGSFDPTFIMSIFYFLIFGLMFADVGYGLVLSAICFVAVRFLHPKPSMKRFLTMFGYCGISCMVMGIIFGSYFGDFLSYFFGNRLILTFDLLEGNGPLYFLVISLAVGAVHMIAGMAVNFRELCKKGRVWDAVFDIGSWWLIFAGLGVWLGLGMVLPGAKIPGLVLLAVGLVLLVGFAGRAEKNLLLRLGKGLLGIYNGVNYVSDLLSYSRIMALGLAAAVIGKVINQIGFMLLDSSPLGLLFMILIFLIGHLLNLVINLLGTFVHTARLQYIEFFGKFYEDGGVPFHAETPSEKYTTDTSSVGDIQN